MSPLPLAGDFTAEQLRIAGLEVPESNKDRQGGLNFSPGTDSENEDLKQRATENSDNFGGEGGETFGFPGGGNTAEEEPAVSPPAPEAAEEESYTVHKMTHSMRLHLVPGFDQEDTTKTMFLMVLELPGGLVNANPTLNEDLMGAKMEFVELGWTST